MSIPAMECQAGVYQLRWLDEGIVIRVDRLHSEKAGVFGEILVESFSPAVYPHIHGPVHYNLISTNTRAQLKRHLEEVHPSDGVLNWGSILEQMSYLVVEAHRVGEPPIHMVDHEAPEALGMRISPILQERMPTLIFGEGDSLKSFLATFLCVITRTGAPQAGLTPEPGNVLYLDYEEDADTFWHRLDMLTTGMNIAIPEGIYWRHMVEPLTAEAPAINKLVREKGIDLVVVDSAAPATLEPENAQCVIPYFSALRSFGVCSLTIAHQTKASAGKGGDYPFGSTMWRNLPRSNFSVRADRNDDDVAISLKHTKANNSRRLKPLGFKFSFDDDAVVVTTAQPTEYADLAQDASLKDRIVESLRHGIRSYEDIADELEESPDTVRRTLNRHKKIFLKQGSQWGVAYRE